MNTHPLIVKTKKSVNKSYLDKGCIRCGHSGLDIRVSPNSLDRALNIMDSLIKVLESKGISVFIKEESYKNKTCVTVSEMTFEIDIYEKITIIKKKEKDQFGSNQYDYTPNGRLVLRIKNAPSETQSEWLDGKRHKLEDIIEDFAEGLNKAVDKEKEWAKQREKWNEEHRKEEEARRIQEMEEERFRALEKEAMSWQRSQMIHAYIEAVTKAYTLKKGNIEPGSEFDKWRAWANVQANRLDPLSKI